MDIPLTIEGTQKGLLEKRFSCVDLIDEYLERINKYDEEINSFLTISDDLAYSQAKKVDKRIENLGKNAFKEKPLLGTVVAHKDMFLTKGVRTTAGSKVLESYVPAYSATVVERLEKAGCVMIGKLNQDAWAHGASGENSDFGATKNPWDKERVPGGSSSGSGAALASNFATFTTGTDTGGSVRSPANFCGLVGLKPTYGSVSRYGIVAMASSTDSIGHLTRSVADARKVFNVTKGEDEKDATLKNVDHKKSKDKNFKIGIPKEYFQEGLEKEVEKEVRRSIKVLEKSGVEFKKIRLPHTKYAISVYYIIMPAEVSSNLGRYDGIRYGSPRENFGDEAKRRIMLGSYVLSAGYYDAYYLKAMKVRSKIIEDFDKAFEKVDAIIAPVAPTTAFKLGEKADNPLQMYLSDVYVVSANLAGIPALAVPTGLTNNNLPCGFQMMGPRFSEETLFNIGEIYEKAADYKPMIADLDK